VDVVSMRMSGKYKESGPLPSS